MDVNLTEIYRIKMEKTASALQKNNFNVVCVPDRTAALQKLEELLPAGATVGVGGSATLNEVGVLPLLRNGNYRFFDRYDPSLSREQAVAVMKRALTADCFITSTNAVTENGELYNVDGNANRVAPMLFGPDRVFVIAGINKIVPDLDAAAQRVKQIAAPANCVRLGLNNPCTVSGSCVNCRSESRICADTVIMARQRSAGRVTVILVAEALGF